MDYPKRISRLALAVTGDGNIDQLGDGDDGNLGVQDDAKLIFQNWSLFLGYI